MGIDDMEVANDMISGFDSRVGDRSSPEVDFSSARRLERSGSTCDAFECVVGRRRVFVKRLKEEFRNNPVYRAAFDKEYDLGVSLSHPSLPQYVGFGGDYIMMNYIEGDTLADLIKRNDHRLRNRKFGSKILRDLTDAISYLHHRNVIHCDVKADNVIVSPYDDRPSVLIDLDKAYTSWLDSTPGDARKYGCVDCADGQIDFRGLGKIASQLGMKRIAAECRKDNVTGEAIKKLLRPRGSKTKMIVGMGLAVLIAMTGWLMYERGFYSQPEDLAEEVEDNASYSQTGGVISEENAEGATADNHNDSKGLSTVNTENAENRKDKFPASDEVTIKETNETVDKIVKIYYGPLYSRLDYLEDLIADPKASSEQLRLALTSYSKEQMEMQGKIFKSIMERYGLTDAWDSQSMLGTSKEWNRFMQRDAKITSLYSKEIDRRQE